MISRMVKPVEQRKQGLLKAAKLHMLGKKDDPLHAISGPFLLAKPLFFNATHNHPL